MAVVLIGIPARVDLFIDLVWVGIISNISEHFYNRQFGADAVTGAITEFILLFLPAWRIWSALQAFLSSFYMEDLTQRILIFWILFLGIVYGNNAPYMIHPANPDTETAASSYFLFTYQIAICSLGIFEALYSIWIPWLRRSVYVSIPPALLSLGLWIATILVDPKIQPYLLSASIAFDYFWYLGIHSAFGEKMQGKQPYRKTHNPEVRRLVIAFTEGMANVY